VEAGGFAKLIQMGVNYRAPQVKQTVSLLRALTGCVLVARNDAN
jgi:hypothetical protein